MPTSPEISQLYHEVHGSGPPLVLLAGFGSDLLSWSFQRDAFAARHKVVLLDNRGVGRSPTPAGPYTITQMAGDVIALLDKLGLEKVKLVGHSMGSSIAQELAIRHPERLDRMVLVSTFSKDGERVLPVLEAWVKSWEGDFNEEIMAKKVLPYIYSDKFFENPNRVRATLGFLKAHPYPPRVEGLRGQLNAVGGHNTWDRLGQIKVPTLVLAGELDRLTSPSITKEVAERIPGAQFQGIPGAAHACMLEQADLFERLVLKFLG